MTQYVVTKIVMYYDEITSTEILGPYDTTDIAQKVIDHYTDKKTHYQDACRQVTLDNRANLISYLTKCPLTYTTSTGTIISNPPLSIEEATRVTNSVRDFNGSSILRAIGQNFSLTAPLPIFKPLPTLTPDLEASYEIVELEEPMIDGVPYKGVKVWLDKYSNIHKLLENIMILMLKELEYLKDKDVDRITGFFNDAKGTLESLAIILEDSREAMPKCGNPELEPLPKLSKKK